MNRFYSDNLSVVNHLTSLNKSVKTNADKTFKDYLIIDMLQCNHNKERSKKMYLQILKKDLKRKKTMNIVLLLFVILAVMFSASSVNNILAVANGLDNFFKKAGMTDYYLIANETGGKNSISDFLDNEKSVDNYKKENIIFGYSDNFTDENGKKLSASGKADFSNAAILMSIKEAKLKYFDSNDNIIKNVDEGKVYFSGPLANKSQFKIGEKIQIHLGDTVLELEYVGIAKDAFLGGEMMGNPRCILNDNDYKKLYSDKNVQKKYSGGIYYINTNNSSAYEKAITNIDNIELTCDKSLVKMTYVMNMLVAGLLLVVSVCLILVSFVALAFTIKFTISEEFREIGVMKAIGIKNNSIRSLYLVKYFGIAVIGAFVGFFANLPFSKMMLKNASGNMVLSNNNYVISGILCAVFVVAVILLFCWKCTGKIKKLSPVDAVRNGETGERFSRKSLLHLGKSKLNTNGFLALNDIISSPKQFSIMTIVFTICTLLVMILANTANTLNSEKLLYLLGTQKSDLYYISTSKTIDVMNGSKTVEEQYKDIEKILKDNNMSGKVRAEKMFLFPVKKGDKTINLSALQGDYTKTTDYTYSEGTAPEYENEIAITKQAADELNAKIGDEVEINIDGKEKKYIITALFQSMVQLGKNIRISENLKIRDTDINNIPAFQIDFNDNPDKEEIEKRKEKLMDIFGTKKIFNTEEYVKDMTGAADIVNGVKQMVLILNIIITAMMAVLMERSFITKEKSEIALMKAIGIKSRSIIAVHTLRFAIIAAVAAIISILISTPLTKVCIDPIFSMMGAISGIEYEIKPVEIFAVYPVIMLAAISISAFFTSLYTKKIKASDTSDME